MKDALRSRVVQSILLGILVLYIALKGLLPLLVSTSTVKTGMEDALSTWTGGRATIIGEPTLSFWPNPTITMHWVEIRGTGADASAELASAQSITATFSVMAALRGVPVFYDFKLVNPLLKIERRIDGSLNWSAGGRLAKAIRAPSSGTPDSMPGGYLGVTTIENGVLLVSDRLTGRDYRISDISGEVRWPTLSDRLDASLTARIKDEKVDWTFACDQPLLLLSGETANLSTSLTSAPLTVKFQGSGNLSASPFASGSLNASAASFASLLSWYGVSMKSADSLEQISLDAAVTTSGSTIKLDGLKLGIRDTTGSGVLDIALPVGKEPRISGTLALNTIDLKAFLSSLSPLPSDAEELASTVNMNFLQQLQLDLRLSAQTAVFGPVPLTDLAAGVLVENGRASLDIGSSTFADGELTGRLAVSQEGFEGGGELQLSLKNADFGSAINILQLKGPLPVGRGNINIAVSSRKPLWATSPKDLSGKFELTADNGFISNFDMATFESLIAKGGFFSLAESANGALNFTSVDVLANLSGGLAKISRARVAGSEQTLRLSGVIPYSSGSLALAGVIEPVTADADPKAASSINFFVGGSWPEPVISPLSVLTGRPAD
ncbi:AsmA family protein [Pararhizobium sp.]|uniref:AsmA family protein n=1 Tax=Pararhizobium sp. TaxID=1977563 RepID=UPI0027230741|nr:AsmA-like C-terminal region-containing protein [Pararhizobium sp.]MDO9418294.1 AsmA-like C-terminal region-containing protein [Pararhizobium sp.]